MSYLAELKALDEREAGTRAYCEAMVAVVCGGATEEQHELVAFETNARRLALRAAFNIKSRWRVWRRGGLDALPPIYAGREDRLFAGPSARRLADRDRRSG